MGNKAFAEVEKNVLIVLASTEIWIFSLFESFALPLQRRGIASLSICRLKSNARFVFFFALL